MVWTADAFLQKRYQAGRTEERAEILKFIEEHPEMTLDQVREHLLQGSGNGRNGKTE